MKQLDNAFNITPTEVEVDPSEVKDPVGIQQPPTKDDLSRDYVFDLDTGKCLNANCNLNTKKMND